MTKVPAGVLGSITPFVASGGLRTPAGGLWGCGAGGLVVYPSGVPLASCRMLGEEEEAQESKEVGRGPPDTTMCLQQGLKDLPHPSSVARGRVAKDFTAIKSLFLFLFRRVGGFLRYPG